MRLPTMRGTIERRLLVNYRVDRAVLQAVLPEPFRPWLVDDCGVAGICLIRLGSLRPVGLPAWIGPTTEKPLSKPRNERLISIRAIRRLENTSSIWR